MYSDPDGLVTCAKNCMWNILRHRERCWLIYLANEPNQRVLNRWSKLSEQKLGFFSKVKIKKNAFNKNDGHIGFIQDRKKLEWFS